jgi:predicted  nucleic acid-binding Zn-ribbon protein
VDVLKEKEDEIQSLKQRLKSQESQINELTNKQKTTNDLIKEAKERVEHIEAGWRVLETNLKTLLKTRLKP